VDALQVSDTSPASLPVTSPHHLRRRRPDLFPSDPEHLTPPGAQGTGR